MKDFFGNELEVGMTVAWQNGGRYPDLNKARIIGFTPKMVKIVYTTWGDREETTNVHPNKLVIPRNTNTVATDDRRDNPTIAKIIIDSVEDYYGSGFVEDAFIQLYDMIERMDREIVDLYAELTDWKVKYYFTFEGEI